MRRTSGWSGPANRPAALVRSIEVRWFRRRSIGYTPYKRAACDVQNGARGQNGEMIVVRTDICDASLRLVKELAVIVPTDGSGYCAI
jgi:hypothetical protein